MQQEKTSVARGSVIKRSLHQNARMLVPAGLVLVTMAACQLPLLGNIMTPPPRSKPAPTPMITPIHGRQTLQSGNVDEMREVMTFASDDDQPIADLAFSADGGELVAVHGLSGRVNRWNTEDGVLLKTVEVGPVGVAAANFDGEGIMLAVGAGATDPAIEAGYVANFLGAKVWNTWTGEQVWEDLLGQDDPYNLRSTDVTMSQDGRYLLVVSDGGYEIWDVFKNTPPHMVAIGYMEPLRDDRPPAVTAALFDQTGDWVAWAHDGGMITIETWGPQDEGWQLLPGVQESPLELAIDPARRYLAMATTESLMLWNLQSWSSSPAWTQTHVYTPAAGLSFSPDGKLLAVATEAGWQIRSTKSGKLLLESEQPAYAVTFSPDGRMLAVGDIDGTVHLWGVLQDQ